MENSGVTSDLREEVMRLAPWYMDIEVSSGLTTRAFLDAPPRPGSQEVLIRVQRLDGGRPSLATAHIPAREDQFSADVSARATLPFLNPRQRFVETLQEVYPDGLEGRSVLDCACNCGGYLFWAKELGAGKCFGFDVREHWINQAKFLAKHRSGPTDDMQFEVLNLYDLPRRELERFDLVLFQGLFYHLPEPVTALKIVAEQTNEMLIVETVSRTDLRDGLLVASDEGVTDVTAGVHGLRWVPTGPQVLSRILEWTGLPEIRCNRWKRFPGANPARARVQLLAAGRAEVFGAYDAAGEMPGAGRLQELIRAHVPPEETVLVASGGDDALTQLDGRHGWHFPQRGGDHEIEERLDDDALIANLEELRERGATYLLIPSDATRLRERHQLWEHLERSYSLVAERDGGAIFALDT